MTIVVMTLSVFILMADGSTIHSVVSMSKAAGNTMAECEKAKLLVKAKLAEAKSAGRVVSFDIVCVPLNVTSLFRGGVNHRRVGESP